MKTAPTPRRHGRALGVFLKAPRRGEVKTRLAATCGEARATALYQAFVKDVLGWTARLEGADVSLFFAPAQAREQCAALAPAAGRRHRLEPQRGRSLGKRLEAAFGALLGRGERAVVIGTDCPTVDRALVTKAYRMLGAADLVLGPGVDGGYYLIGLRRPAPALFRGLRWSTSRVLEETIARARGAGLRWRLLEPRRDVDTAGDLAALRDDLLAAWRAVRARRSDDFPLHTFRELCWEFDELLAPASPPST